MINRQAIEEWTSNSQILEFADYAIRVWDDNKYIPFREFNLMDVASLASNAFVIDVAPEDGRRLLFRYTGTKVDQQYGQNLMGQYLEDVYTGTDRETVINSIKDVTASGRVGYMRKFIVYQDAATSYRLVERISFPCSTDGTSVDRIVGTIFFTPIVETDENIAILL